MASVVMEDHQGEAKFRNATLNLDDFLTLDNPNKAWRLSLSRTGGLRRKVAATKWADEYAKVPKKLLDIIQNTKDIEPYEEFQDDMRLGQDLRAEERVDYLEKQLGITLPTLGEGSSRLVVAISEKTVLKMAKNEAGIAQNEVEYRAYEKVEDCSMITRIFYYDEDFEWLICERVIREADEDDFLMYMKPPSGYDDEDMLDTFVHTAFYYKDPNHKDIKAYLIDRVAFKSLRFLLSQGIKKSDLSSTRQWGLVERKGERYPVLVDYGFNQDVANRYY